jgi:hypothetical protein
MFEDSIGRGERQARALVLVVLAIEAIWVFLHKYLPADAALWTLQSDLIGKHLVGNVGDGFSLMPVPTANMLGPLVSWLFGLLLGSEVAMRFWMAFGGIFLRGAAMLTLLQTLRVRDASVYYLIPVFAWSGIFFSGAYPYLFGETIALFLIVFLLRQDHPRRFQYLVLIIGFAFVALLHALAFIICAAFIFFVAKEQQRSIHLSQGWLSNTNSVLGLVLPGFIILLLRIVFPAPVFSVSTSGLVPLDASGLLLFMITVSPHILEASFPTADIICTAITAFVIILVLSSLVRAFLLPMEEVSWQSRSAKGAGTVLLILSIAGFFISPLGIQTQAYIWTSAFLILSGSYSRGPAVRRTSIDRLLNALGFIAMLAAGGMNALGTNRGSDAASDVRADAMRLIESEKRSSSQERGVRSLDIRYVIDSALYESMKDKYIGTLSYSVSVPLYLYSKENILENPAAFQPKAGVMSGSSENFVSPLDLVRFDSPDKYFRPELRFFAAVPAGALLSSRLGPYVHSLKDTSSAFIQHGDVKYSLLLGTPSPEHSPGLALQ